MDITSTQIIFGKAASRFKNPGLYNFLANKGLALSAESLPGIRGRHATVQDLKQSLSLNLWTPPSCTVIFVRHPATNESAVGRLVGQNDVPINDKGREQMPLLYAALSGINFSRIYSSPLQRCSVLADYVGDKFGLPVKFMPNDEHGA